MSIGSWLLDHAHHMFAMGTLVGNQSGITGDRSDRHDVFHGRSALWAGWSFRVIPLGPLGAIAIDGEVDPFRLGSEAALERRRQRRPLAPGKVVPLAIPKQRAIGDRD